ncbi:MAG: hypothetical protein HY247_01405 [archaeon]|nr:MAG: hypothetical protein HY247_01405 [archaeon]
MARIKVRLGSSEAEVEADPEQLKDVIDLIPVMISKLPTEAQPPLGGPQRKQADLAPMTDAASQEDMPSVALDKSDSLSDVIEKFFSDPWGREKRKLSDVREVLQSYGLNYPKQSVAVALLRLAKATKIRRFKAADGEFVYTSSGVSRLSTPGIIAGPGEIVVPRTN